MPRPPPYASLTFDVGDRLVILRVTTRCRCKHAAKSVNHVSFIAINYISVRGLHFETTLCGPGAAAQHSPVATSCTVIAFVSVETPFPNVPAEIVEAYRIGLETSDGQRCAASLSRSSRIISCVVWRRPLFTPRKFVLNFAVTRFGRRTVFIHQTYGHAPLGIGRQPISFSIVNQIFVPFFFGQPFAKRHGVEPAHFYSWIGWCLMEIGRLVSSAGRTAKRFVILYARFPDRNLNVAKRNELHA